MTKFGGTKIGTQIGPQKFKLFNHLSYRLKKD